MNAQQEIGRLKRQIELLENEIKNCIHNFKDPIYDPEEITVQDDNLGYEIHGSDMWPRYSSHKEKKPRWSRECKTCGKKEYTYTQKPIVQNLEPDFGK